jgi:hypothetical protein
VNKAEAADIVKNLVLAYPSVTFTPENATRFQEMISDLNREETIAAVESLSRISKFMPSVAEIRDDVYRTRKRAQADWKQQPKLQRVPNGPSPVVWSQALTGMLSDAERYDRMAKAWYASKCKPYPGDPGKEHVELAAAGARGDDVRQGFKTTVLGDQDETDRRYP